jgi:hypothetical protein
MRRSDVGLAASQLERVPSGDPWGRLSARRCRDVAQRDISTTLRRGDACTAKPASKRVLLLWPCARVRLAWKSCARTGLVPGRDMVVRCTGSKRTRDATRGATAEDSDMKATHGFAIAQWKKDGDELSWRCGEAHWR